MRLHHVQVSMPRGQEAVARRFYQEALGLTEVDKPPALRDRGGCWFRAWDDTGAVAVEIHVGVEDPFAPARKAHPAILVDDAAALDALADRIRAAGFEVSTDERTSFLGHLRFHAADGFGNRIECLAPLPPKR